MVRRTYSIVLSVDRGLPHEDIADWIEESLQGVVEINSFNTLAVTYYPVREIVYGQIRTLNFTSVPESRIRSCLSSPPDKIKVLELSRLESARDMIVEMPVKPDTRPNVSMHDRGRQLF